MFWCIQIQTNLTQKQELTQNQLKNWGCKMTGDILYEVKYLIHCIMYRGIGIEFCWVLSHCGLYWNEVSDKLAKQGAMKNMSETSYSNLLLLSHEIISILEKNVYKQNEKSKLLLLNTFLFKAFSNSNL